MVCRMGELELQGLVADFARGMEKADARRPQQVSSRTGKAYQPGLGPHTEAKTVDLVMLELETTKPDVYKGYATGFLIRGSLRSSGAIS